LGDALECVRQPAAGTEATQQLNSGTCGGKFR
jgi:hypothetical protein